MDIIDEIKNFVQGECKKPGSKYGYEPYQFHFIPMVKYAQTLAQKLGADEEIVSLAAWLHDIGSIIYGRENHHLTGAKVAEIKLKSLEYPKDRIAKIKKCILNHRCSQKNHRLTLEQRIIADADAISNFDNVSGIFKAAFVYENQDQGTAKDTTRIKLARKYQQLHFEDSKEIIRPKYEAAMILLA